MASAFQFVAFARDIFLADSLRAASATGAGIDIADRLVVFDAAEAESFDAAEFSAPPMFVCGMNDGFCGSGGGAAVVSG